MGHVALRCTHAKRNSFHRSLRRLQILDTSSDHAIGLSGMDKSSFSRRNHNTRCRRHLSRLGNSALGLVTFHRPDDSRLVCCESCSLNISNRNRPWELPCGHIQSCIGSAAMIGSWKYEQVVGRKPMSQTLFFRHG